jgi:hypothetical protein
MEIYIRIHNGLSLTTKFYAIATVVLGLTSFGVVLYLMMIISAMVSPDSPFWTSLTALLKVAIQIIQIPGPIYRVCRVMRELFSRSLDPLCTFILSGPSAVYSLIKASPPLLPRFKPEKPPMPARIFDKNPEPSPEVSAVLWVLETSTDAVIVEAAAAMVPDIQWPVDLDLEPAMRRLSDTFHGCLDDTDLRDGKGNRAKACLKAFGMLQIAAEAQGGL